MASAMVANERVYVAVGKDAEQSKSTLEWALNTFDGHFRILHVHRPGPTQPSGTSAGSQELEMENMHKILDAYINICSQAQVYAEKRFLENRDIGKGIVELVEQHAITKLVMGAAADIHYYESMTELKSAKAMFVDLHAHPSCQIWFVCGGRVIRKREGDLNTIDMDVMPLSSSLSPYSAEPNSRLPRTPSTGSSEVDDDLLMVTYERGEPSRTTFTLSSSRQDDAHHFPPYSSQGTVWNSEIYSHFEKAMVEAENARREAFQELMRRMQECESDIIEANRRERAFENLYKEEMRRRRELEVIYAEERESHEMVNKQKEEAILIFMDHRKSLENQVSASNQIINELNGRIAASEGVLEICKKEIHDLQAERDDAVRLMEELRKNRPSASSSNSQDFLSQFSFLEIQIATKNFDPSMNIGEDGCWSTFKGFLRHTHVAVKKMGTDSPCDPSWFQRELDIMTNLRHPNIVTLIGVCHEARALIYEHMPNGSLEDLLMYHEDKTPLPYQSRIRIASQICSALIFLHTNHPHFFVHGDLRLANIMLDANFVAKLCGLGNGPSQYRTNLEPADFPHLDPHYLSTGEMSAKSDVYSFGVLLLQLLTGRVALDDFASEIRDAVNGENMSYMATLLDPLAGEWPVTPTADLVRLALRCCNMDPSDRPDLGSQVWSMLKEMLADSHAEVGPSDHRSYPEEGNDPPDDFLCPISRMIMQEPAVAADGHTYEKEALISWFSTGSNISPKTNLPLPHLDLIPNYTFRSFIQEWLQTHPHQFSVS
ncbi:hypothetical protein SAY86_019678 [Trapa natans]|uniref:RING-type E3 ubiquitin transferase n=1 Tax=Trapa natans TaxID=22666 RepID=A0AAN7R158_TRANT|nr:hypothetical protein SAY86_019678 [Trapa natans]